MDSIVVNEIYASLQGESSWAGLPCIFVRTTGCPLRCSYCDTAYAFFEGKRLTTQAVLDRIQELAEPYSGVRSPGGGRLPLVEFTGGEPLVQPAAPGLMRDLCDRGFTVLVETSGAVDIGPVDTRVHRIVDVKCPASGEDGRNLWSNLDQLTVRDEVKFVISSRQDYDWAREILKRHKLVQKCAVLFSWAAPLNPDQRHASLNPVPPGHDPISRLELAERVIQDRVPVRFQVQMHKVIWAPDQRGV